MTGLVYQIFALVSILAQYALSEMKQAGVLRIFFSSPFKGMEAEREEFTKTYWPKIDSFCKSKGLQFVPVDMRWGITEELSKNNQTINVCLSEIDRSDMFVGFFGQVYFFCKRVGSLDLTTANIFLYVSPPTYISNFTSIALRLVWQGRQISTGYF